MTEEQRQIHRQLVAEFYESFQGYLNQATDGEDFERRVKWLSKMEPCCHNEDRNMNGWCQTCGDPCF